MPNFGSLLATFFAPPRRAWDAFEKSPQWLWQQLRREPVARLAGLINAGGLAVAAVLFAGLLQSHLRVVMQPGPQEFNEPAIWQVTWLLDHQRNPYTLNELPGSAYFFGPLYNYVVIALKPLLGIDYPAHRMVALIFLGLSLVVLVRAMLRAGAGAGIAALSVMFYYWMSLRNIEITARPDTMGLFFFLLGILVPWERGYTRGATVCGLVCAVVAFNCKSYFAAAGCVTLLTHFLVRDKLEAFWLGAFFFALLGLTFAYTCWRYPYFYIETVIAQRNGAILNDREDVSVMHTVMLFERGWPYFLMIAAGVAAWAWRWARKRSGVPEQGAVIGPIAHGRSAFVGLGASFVALLAVVYFYMGRNAGAFFTYHLHLVFPLLMVLAAYAVNQTWRRLVFGLVLIGFCFAWVKVPQVVDTSMPYRRMEQIIREAKGEVLGIASQTDIFERMGRPVLHNGNTMFIGFTTANNGAQKNPAIAALCNKFLAVDAVVRRKIEARAYAVVFSELDEPYFCSPEVLKKNYERIEQIDYYTYFGHRPVRVWVPKPRTPSAE